MKLITGDGCYSTFKSLPYGQDAFGNPVIPEEGYYILPRLTKLQEGDCPFDVYSGWLPAGHMNLDYCYQAYASGRWRAYQRRIHDTSAEESE